MKKLNNKGFTLIEMVIVIVIIAILAAMLVPSLLSYVDNANKKSFLEACNTIKTSTLSNMTDNYAETGTYSVDYAKVTDLVGKEVKSSGTAAKNTYIVTFSPAKTFSTFEVTNGTYTGTWTSANGWSVK